MHPRIKELVEALDSRRADLTRAVNEVPASARNRRPSEDRWSVAEVLEHLALVEENIPQRVKALVSGSPKRMYVCTGCIKSGKIVKAG